MHTFAFVHKNVRLESVLCFEDPEASNSHVFPVGFDAFRGASTGTIMDGDTNWDRNVYRHPHHQGTDPSEKYRMQHEIYSLGLCLVEIGFWEPLVEYSTDHDDTSPPQPRFGKFFNDFQAWNKHQGKGASANTMAFQFKDYHVEKARTRLASRVGDKYAHVAVSCLTCLDDDNDVFGGLEAEENDNAVAVNFIEKVMLSLDEIPL